MSISKLAQAVGATTYPGRGIVLGKSADGRCFYIAYFIMGRSENSRNRIFEDVGRGIRTKAFDESKMVDPSLIIYAPVRVFGDTHIVTNGDQTDTIYEALEAGGTFEDALRTRTFEPDAPNTDIGLRNARLNYRQYDPGHIMENIIYNELLRRGYSVDVGVVTDRTGGANVQKEIDFVVNDADKKIYIQSAFQMDTDKKESSELASLILTKDFFKKIIVRMDIPHNFYDDNGIFHCNLIDLLLGRVELF